MAGWSLERLVRLQTHHHALFLHGDFPQVFALLAEKGYRGPLSYEAPNPAAWGRDPMDVAREALEATRTQHELFSFFLPSRSQ